MYDMSEDVVGVFGETLSRFPRTFGRAVEI